jgi:molybdopterin/thiamine biosynthesis adenylyltransferase
MNNTIAVIIVGAGGIGSALFQDLCRFLPHTLDIHLMDGDLVEGRNVQRQMFSKRHLGRNKAQCLVETASTALGRNGLYYHTQFLADPGQLHEIAKHYQAVILVGAVDNHPGRRRMEAFVRDDKRSWTYYVDCANDKTTGEVVAVYGYQDRIIYGTFRSELDPRVLEDDSGDPTTASCTQQLDAGNIQTLFTNRKAAIIALELISSYLTGDVKTGIVYFRDCQISRLKVVTNLGSEEVVPVAETA